ncbi:GNAT family N-acetyltransferase [Nocardiopsis lucentensis]|uniref:GNAT family N-acetyltransferase n=1 Tax=Nocardiopsis lucentensis TaxID=53441 RepID=UPI000348586E|nr:GNAT family N-acetyltransferase [Nocardiopsis lucentensis]
MTPTTPADVGVRTATMNDVARLVRVLGRAFQDDPLFRWFFPDGEDRLARSMRVCALNAGFGHVPGGTAWVHESRETAGGTPVIGGAALWTPPGETAEGPLTALRSLPHWVRLMGVARVLRVFRFLGAVRATAPEEPHWYLAVLGTDPAVQGTGVGSRLLRDGLARADADGVPVYLETMNPANIGFYERHGFRVVRAVNEPSAPPTYCMLRPLAV